jgi:tetratricopeptide (TPR) repeat protein
VKMSRYGEAIVYYRSAIKLGGIYENVPSTIEAIQAYEDVEAIAPRSDVVNFILGEAYLKVGLTQKALQKYRVLTVLKSGYSNPLFRDIRSHPDNLDLSGVEDLDLKCPKESSRP